MSARVNNTSFSKNKNKKLQQREENTKQKESRS